MTDSKTTSNDRQIRSSEITPPPKLLRRLREERGKLMTDLRNLITRMANELDHYRQLLMDDRSEVHALAAEARAALVESKSIEDRIAEADAAIEASIERVRRIASMPAREIAAEFRARAALAESEPEGPTDEELLCIASKAICGYSNGIEVGEYEPVNECAVEAYGSELCNFARAVLARWGN